MYCYLASTFITNCESETHIIRQ